ncbi:hypothetical protein [uncultured Aureimonas sp.]|uniref:hypothetical protein n=1 Tax=uncultured Aureimonas sp. TaxID=1604662 RepID=UPI0025D55115|nr:hypothetical protein [uncultured Aureimonas sp.]
MSVDAIAQTELRQLFALIGRNIAGDPLPPERPEAGDGGQPAARVRPAVMGLAPAGPGVSPPADRAPAEALDMAERTPTEAADPPSLVWTLIGLRSPTALHAETSRTADFPPTTGEMEVGGTDRSETAARLEGSARTAGWMGEDAPGAAPSSPSLSPARLAALAMTGSGLPIAANASSPAASARSAEGEAATPTSTAARMSAPSGVRPADTERSAAPSARGATGAPPRPAAPEPEPARPVSVLGVPMSPGGSEALATLVASSGLLAEGGSAQAERAGVIASFVLNAAMIPGWPPPRPIEAASFARAMALPASHFEQEEMEAGLLLLHAIRDSGLAGRLLLALAAERRRRRLLAVLALLAAQGRALADLLASGAANALPAPEPETAGGRRHLMLR